jgi:cytochrome c biogenesis protein CcdA
VSELAWFKTMFIVYVPLVMIAACAYTVQADWLLYAALIAEIIWGFFAFIMWMRALERENKL